MNYVRYLLQGAFLFFTGFCYAQTAKQHPDSILNKRIIHTDSSTGHKASFSAVDLHPGISKDSISKQIKRSRKNISTTIDSAKQTLSRQYKRLQSKTKKTKTDSSAVNKKPVVKTLLDNSPLSKLLKNKKDTSSKPADSMFSNIQKMQQQQITNLDSGFHVIEESIKTGIAADLKKMKHVKPDSLALSMLPALSFKGVLDTNQFIKFSGGYLSYNFNYRSNTDTPFLEKNIQQHNVYGYMNTSVAGLPFTVNYLIRRSNSAFFRDITDIQVQFDPAQFRDNLLKQLNTQVQKNVKFPEDPLLKTNISSYVQKLKGMEGWLNNPFTLQKLTEYKELLAVPALSHTPGLPDSVNKSNEEKRNKEAKSFIDGYEQQKNAASFLRKDIDSLEQSYKKLRDAFEMRKKALGSFSSGELKDISRSAGDSLIPKKYRWLLGIRKFGIGRNQLNYSELTSKNMSLTGINFEYNSWYYAAIAAGKVDYRFRDFAVNKNSRVPQYMSMIRLGIGRVENTHLFISVFKGRKQLFAATGNSNSTKAIDITGLSVEGKLRINTNSYLTAEGAESVSPDFRKTPLVPTKFNLTDKSNKALSLRFYSFFPRTYSRIEAAYKFTGANYQSFSSFQTNSETVSWSVKADQQFLRRKLRLVLAIKKNEFSNPYITQAYKNNTVFKSIQLTYRAKHFPVISAGFAPISQITSVDSQLVENQFYSLNASVSHTYKIGFRRATSAFIYNKFYNNYTDTSFLYYKAKNIFFNQSVEFSRYTMNVSVSHSSNTSFTLTVFDAGILFNATSWGMIGFGAKINELGNQDAKTGLYGSLQLRMPKLGIINARYNSGFIPGKYNQLVKNEMFDLGFIKNF